MFTSCIVHKPGGIIKDNPVAEKLLITDLARWTPPPRLVGLFIVLEDGGRVGHKFAVTGKLKNSSFFSGEVSSGSFSDKLLVCLKIQFKIVLRW